MKPIKKLIVLGGSAGSIPSLCTILRELPATLDAAVMAVVHLGDKESFLPQVLQRSTSWKVVVPKDVEPISAGRVYLAATGRHLVVRDGCALSLLGPRENRHRPAVDVLFRSAARAHSSHVVAVILSGALDDGSAGALAVKARHGTVIIEDPALAQHADMPRNVQRYVGADYSLPAAGIPTILKEIVPTGSGMKTTGAKSNDCQRLARQAVWPENPPEMFSCPECGGALKPAAQNGMTQFHCHVGHVFSLDSFSEAESEALERAIWTAYRKLKEHRAAQITLAKQQGNADRASRFRQSANVSARDLKLLRGILERL